MRPGRFWIAALGVTLLAASAPASAQTVDPADIAFWQSIQDSQNAAEFEAYLNSFPDGVFAELARLRIEQFAAAPSADSPAPAGAVAQSVPRPDAPLSDVVLSVSPPQPGLGEPFKIVAANMPPSSPYDQFVIVDAAAPDDAGIRNQDAVIKSTYSANEYTLANGWEAGPLAPGLYEVRWLTTLFNNENRLELAARTRFQVSR